MAFDYSAASEFEERWRGYWALGRPRGVRDLARWVYQLADRRLLHSDELEYIDRPELGDRLRVEVIALVDWTSRALAIGRHAARWLRPLCREVHRRTRRPVRILDVGCGRGGITLDAARALERWGEVPVVVSGLDYNPRYLELAREEARRRGQPEVRFVEGNAFDLAHDAGAFDLLITNWMIHHLTPVQVFRMVQEFDRVAAHGMMLLDVSRSFLTAAGGLLVTALLSEPRRHDSMLTLRKGYRRAELELILAAAGIDYVEPIRLPLGLPPIGACLLAGLKPIS